MQQLFTNYPWLVLLGAVLVGMFIMWLLEMFVLRRTIKSNLAELEASLKQRDSELQTAQATLKESNAALKSKGDELLVVAAARTAADKQAADLNAQLTKTTSDFNSQLAKASSDLEAAQKTRQQLETSLNTRTAELNDQRAKLGALTTQANETAAQAQSLAGERDQLRATLAAAQSDLTDTKAQSRSALSEVAKLTATAAATAAIVKGLESSKSQLTANIDKLNGELKNARADSERLNGLLNETNTAKAAVETELSDTKTRVGDLEGVVTALEGQVAELEGKNSALDADVAKLTAGALAASEVIRLLEGNKAELTAAQTALRGEHESLQRAKALDDADLAELKVQLNQVNESLGITMRDKETYQETLAARVDELGRAQTELAQVKGDNSNLLADVAKFTARAATAAALVQELEGSKRHLTGQVQRLSGELDAERERAAALTLAASPAPAGEIANVPASEDPVLSTLAAEGAVSATLVSNLTATPPPDDDTLPLESVCPQDMSSIKGIGPDFEQRLYNAGIGTYWDLSQLGEDELAAILELDEVRRMSVNLAGIRGDALRLARETRTQKRTWKGGTPDDFDKIHGIGRVYEGRLYEAGICTYQALAQCTVDRLASICQAPNLDHSRYQSWIDQAAAFVQARGKS